MFNFCRCFSQCEDSHSDDTEKSKQTLLITLREKTSSRNKSTAPKKEICGRMSHV